VTIRPAASTTARAGSSIVPIATIVPSLTATSARRGGSPVPSMTSPPLMSTSYISNPHGAP
jgi:hypothetical protein